MRLCGSSQSRSFGVIGAQRLLAAGCSRPFAPAQNDEQHHRDERGDQHVPHRPKARWFDRRRGFGGAWRRRDGRGWGLRRGAGVCAGGLPLSPWRAPALPWTGRASLALPVRSGRRRSLPDSHASIRRKIELRALLHGEGFVPFVHVAHRAIGAEFRRRVRIGDDLVAQRLIADQAAPDLAEAEEEALDASVTVDHRRRLAAERDLVGLERDVEAAQIADVLAERQPAVDVEAGKRLELRILIGEPVRELLKLFSSCALHHLRRTPFSSDFAP